MQDGCQSFREVRRGFFPGVYNSNPLIHGHRSSNYASLAQPSPWAANCTQVLLSMKAKEEAGLVKLVEAKHGTKARSHGGGRTPSCNGTDIVSSLPSTQSWKMYVHASDDAVSQSIRATGSWEPETTQVLLEALASGSCRAHKATFVDMGSNIGAPPLVPCLASVVAEWPNPPSAS